MFTSTLKRLAALVCTAAVLLTAGAAYAADEQPVATADAQDGVATIVSPLESASTELRQALDRYGRLDPAFQDWVNKVMGCVESSAKTTSLPTGTIGEARGTLRTLLESCASSLGVSLTSSAGPAGSLPGLGKPPASVASASTSCKSGVDPRLGQDDGSDVIVPLQSAKQIQADADAKKAKEDAERAQAAALAARAEANKLDDDTSPEDRYAAHLFALAKENRAAELNKEAVKKQQEADAINNRPPSGGERPSQFAENGCSAAAEQIAECERLGWSTLDCSRIKSGLDGCTVGDPQITDPIPVTQEEAQPGCSGTLTAEEFAAAALHFCESLVNYGPDGVSPCAPRVGAVLDLVTDVWCFEHDGRTLCYFGVNPCGSAVITPLPDGEGCTGEATFLELRPSLAEALAAAVNKLGGPIWTPPSTGPGPSPEPGGGPDGPRP